MNLDLIDSFRNFFKDNKVVLDSYNLEDGYYYLVKNDGKIEKLTVKNHEGDNYELYKYIKVRDFYSKYIDSNKAICTTITEFIDDNKYTMEKKIHSNNIYTLFFSNNSVIGMCNNQETKKAVPIEVFEKGINKYYESLLKFGASKKEKMLLQECYTPVEIEQNRLRMISAFRLVYQDFQKEEKQKDTKIRIFLDAEEDEYKRVGNIYYTLKLFNTNDNNINYGNTVYGINNYNYGLNSSKPYLKLKSTPYEVGSFVSKEEITILNNIYRWLDSKKMKEYELVIPTDYDFYGIPEENKDEDIEDKKNLYYIKVVKTKSGPRIDDFQYLSKYASKIRLFECKDYIRKVGCEFETTDIHALEWYTNNVWFVGNTKGETNYLKNSYCKDDKSKSENKGLSNWKKDILINNASIFFDLFQREDESSFIKNMDRIATTIVENTLIEDLEEKEKKTYKSLNCLNLWIAFKKYFNKKGENEEMKINNIQKDCMEICRNNGNIETDEQYYYLAGQVAFYLLSLSEASELKQDVIEPFIKAANIKVLKNELRYLYKKYNYKLLLKYSKFNNIMSQLLSQVPETSVKDNKDIILAGMLANNIFWNNEDSKNGGSKDGENE